jgi:hypothetical protein
MDKTKIRINHGGAGISVDVGARKSYRITGFTLVALAKNSVKNQYIESMIAIQGYHLTGNEKSNWRIDHIYFDDDPHALMPYGVGVTGPAYGVIDHCTFDSIGQAIYIQESNARDNRMWGDYAWTRGIDWGGPNAVYVEDCTFIGRIPNQEQVYDGRWGGRIVFRHNQVQDYWIEPHSGCPNGGRAMLHNEIYHNVFRKVNDDGMWMAIRIRGGTGIIFGNDFSSNIERGPILIDNQRSCLRCTPPVDTCDGTSRYDGNMPGYEGWPCMDQIGRGAGQAVEPMYEWENQKCPSPPCGGGGGDVDIQVYPLCARQTQLHVLESRDYYNNTRKPAYTPYVYPHPLTQSTEDVTLPR